jgi:hypothetical protein
MKLEELQFTYDLPIWLHKDDVMKIMECQKSKAFQIIAEINGDVHKRLVGGKVLTNKFIEYYDGEISREIIKLALSNNSMKSTNSK